MNTRLIEKIKSLFIKKEWFRKHRQQITINEELPQVNFTDTIPLLIQNRDVEADLMNGSNLEFRDLFGNKLKHTKIKNSNDVWVEIPTKLTKFYMYYE